MTYSGIGLICRMYSCVIIKSADIFTEILQACKLPRRVLRKEPEISGGAKEHENSEPPEVFLKAS